MREQLIQYVDLLFAGTTDAEDIKQEILQNTLDRYDDLIAQGKTPQAAYQLAISGIGDINEILSSKPQNTPDFQPTYPEIEEDKPIKKWYKGVAIALFILCAIPVLLFENSLGVCLCLAMVAAGVALLVIFGKEDRKEHTEEHAEHRSERRSPLNNAITGAIGTIGLCVYLLVSFQTGAWAITWIIFPIMGCICGIVDAIFDLKKSLGSAIVRIVLFGILIAILLPLGFGFAISIDGPYSVGYTSSSEGSVSSDEIRNIEIEWVSGSITLVPGDSDLILLKETAYSENYEPMIFKQTGDTLHIQFSKANVQIGINQNATSKDLVITVPEGWIGTELNIESVSADVNVSDLTCKEIELNNVSGACEFENCVSDEVKFETVSGGITYRGELTTLECESVSADCEIYASNHPSSINMDGVSCDLTLYLPEDCGFTANVDSMSGDFSSNFPTTTKGSAHVYGDGSCRIESESMSGDIHIRKAN